MIKDKHIENNIVSLLWNTQYYVVENLQVLNLANWSSDYSGKVGDLAMCAYTA